MHRGWFQAPRSPRCGGLKRTNLWTLEPHEKHYTWLFLITPNVAGTNSRLCCVAYALRKGVGGVSQGVDILRYV
jgi:hypothetical protein